MSDQQTNAEGVAAAGGRALVAGATEPRKARLALRASIPDAYASPA